MADTQISWTDKVWNVTRGCRRISAGCGGAKGEGGCYAERQAYRFSGPGQAYEGLVKLTANGPRWTGAGHFAADKLAQPLSWRKPVRVFVDSMSDLFFDAFTNEQIAAVFGVMAACPQHTFQVLTKRARRMREWFAWLDGSCMKLTDPPNPWWRVLHCIAAAGNALAKDGDGAPLEGGAGATWPLPNVWLGVSVENQDAADERIPHLLATPAAVRFLSCEPLLGPVDLRDRLGVWTSCPDCGRGVAVDEDGCCRSCGSDAVNYWVDWVIAGCESGPGARPCDVAWLRSLRDQCGATGTAFFCKQANRRDLGQSCGPIRAGAGSKPKPGGVVELPYLDGVQHAAFPNGPL